MKNNLRKIGILLIALIASFFPASEALCVSESTLKFYSENNILFYDPTGTSTGNSCITGDIDVYGETIEEKIWVGLTGFLTEEQAAGVMGNMAHEGSFNPVKHEISLKNKYQPGFDISSNEDISYGIGLIQWSYGRRVRLVEYIQSVDASLLTYLENYNEYSKDYSYNGAKFLELAGDDVTNRLISIELEFLKDELKNNALYAGIFDQTTVYDSAKYFLEVVERPKNPYIESHPERATDAQKYYDEFANKSISRSGTSTAQSTNGSNVTILGDSLTVRATTALKASDMLPEAEIVAQVGMDWDWGIEQLPSLTLRDNVVFAFGTNNQDGTSGTLTVDQIEKAINQIGSDKNIFFVTNYSTSIDYSENNLKLQAAATKYSNVFVVDWAESASQDPTKYLSSDGIHQSTSDGVSLFADLIYNAVLGDLNSSGCSVSGELTSYVLAYAWPEFHSGPYVERQTAYADIVSKRQQEGKYVGGSVFGVPGIDCGGWVTTLLNESSFEPDYNNGNGNTGTQEQWVKDHGWTLLNPNGNVDTSILEPGDVAFTDGHTWVYVGEIEGFESKIASASYSTMAPTYASARAPMAGRESYEGARWYRKGATQ